MNDSNDGNLRKVFQRYEKLIFKAANSTQSENTYGFVAEFSKKVDSATGTFKQLAKRFVDRDIPKVKTSAKAERVLRQAGATYETANVKLTTYVQMVSKLTASADGLRERVQARIDEDERRGVTTTVTALKDYIKTELQTGRAISVTYSNGAKMPTDKYAEMLSRTTRTETHNVTMLGKAIDDGNDLVECSTVTPTCDICAKYQGRIYSISGKTAGYPALYETAFKHGYSIIHPNCRHQFYPYNPKFHTAEERKALEEGTRRSWEDDNRQGEAAREEYAKSQMQKRQWNKELNEFAEMQKSYAERGEETPYKTLGAFRRAYRAKEGTLTYAKTHYYQRDTQQYNELKTELGANAVPKTFEQFQELKYSKAKVSEYKKLEQLIKQNVKDNATPPYNKTVVDTPDYRKKFENLDLGKSTSEVMRESRRCIRLNDGTSNERGTFINLQGKSEFTFSGKNSSADYSGMDFSKYRENSLILVHNHPHSGSFSADDILTLSNHKQINTIIAAGHDGTVYSLSINGGKRVDRLIISEYNKLYSIDKDVHKVLVSLSYKYGWEYKKL